MHKQGFQDGINYTHVFYHSDIVLLDYEHLLLVQPLFRLAGPITEPRGSVVIDLSK
jgi:hypothetical protein